MLGSYFLYLQGKEAVFNEKYDDLSAISRLKIDQILNWRQERLGDAAVIVGNPLTKKSLIDFLKHPNELQKNELLSWFKSLKKDHNYQEIYLLNKENEIIISTNETNRAADKHIFNFLKNRNLSDSTFISDLHFFGEKTHFSVGISINSEHESMGVLLMIMDPNYFLFPMIQSWPSPSKTAETLLIKKDSNNVLFLNELRHKKNTALKLRIPITQKDLPAALAVQGYEGSVKGIDYRGEKVLADVRKVGNTNWFIVTKVDEKELSGDLVKNTLQILAALILVIIGIYFLLLNILRRHNIKELEKQLRIEKEKQYISAHLKLINYYANDAIITTDSDYKILYANRKAQEIYGYTKDELKEMDMNDLIAESKDRIFDKITDKATNSGAAVVEIDHIRKNGSTFPSESSISYLEVDGIRYSISIIRDVTERKKAEFQISKLTRLYSTLSQLNQAIVRAYSIDELFGQITKVIIKYGGFKAAMIVVKNDKSKEDEPELRVASQTGEMGKYFEELYQNIPAEGYFPSREAIRQKRIIIHNSIDDINQNYQSWIEIAIKYGIHSCVAVPIELNNTVIGSLGIYTSESYFFEKEEIKLIEEIVGDINFALESFEKEKKRLKAEQLVFENERKLSTLIKNMQGIAYRCQMDKYWTMEFISDGCIDITGYLPSDFINNKVIAYADIIHPDDTEYVSRTIDEAIYVDKSFTLTYRIYDKNGKMKWVWERGVGIKDQRGNIIALEGLISDITDTKKAEEELIVAKNKAEAGDRLKSEFLAQMSHEIRTPINVILSFSNFIKDSLDVTNDRDILDGFNAIQNASSRLIRTIDSLLNMSQIQLGNFDVSIQKIHLSTEIITVLFQEFKSLAHAKNLELEVIDNNPDAEIYADLYSVNQLLDNLIHNAIKYTDHGKISIVLDKDENNRPTVSIKDTGIGIKEEYIPYLFDAFSQEETGYTRKFEGTGLGLALVKNYCSLNKADIDVKSKKGEGTVFKVTFQPAG